VLFERERKLSVDVSEGEEAECLLVVVIGMGTLTLQDSAGNVPALIVHGERVRLSRRTALLELSHTTDPILVVYIYYNYRPHGPIKAPMVWGIVTSSLVNAHLLTDGTLDTVHARICKFIMCLCAHPTSPQSQTFRDMVAKAEEGLLNAESRDVQLKSISVGLAQWVSQNSRAAENCTFNIVQGVMMHESSKLIFGYCH